MDFIRAVLQNLLVALKTIYIHLIVNSDVKKKKKTNVKTPKFESIMFFLLYIDLHSLLPFVRSWLVTVFIFSNHTNGQIKSGTCLVELMNEIHVILRNTFYPFIY